MSVGFFNHPTCVLMQVVLIVANKYISIPLALTICRHFVVLL